MNEGIFEASVEWTGDACALRCRGEIDVATIDELSRRVQECLDRGPAKLRVDLTGATFFGSVGAELLLEAARACAEAGVSLDVAPSPPVVRVLDLMDLSWLVDDGVHAQVASRSGSGSKRSQL